MRATVQRVARRCWSAEAGWLGAAWWVAWTPAAWLWAGVTVWRDRRWSRRSPEAVPGLAVVSVGNLAVGATGKTPVASWIVRRLLAAGRRPALLVSGYGRDEVLLHGRWTPSAPVVVGRDRAQAARLASAGGHDVAVADDAFQHRRLARDLDLVLLAVEDPFPGPLLPAGPYRERPSALRRADAVVVTRRTGSQEDARALAGKAAHYAERAVSAGVHLRSGGWSDLHGEPRERPSGDVLAVTSIGRPDAFAAAAAAVCDGKLELVPFGDHHDFGARDVDGLVKRARGRPWVVTEKDAVKLVHFAAELADRCYVLSQEIVWEWGEAEIGALLSGLAPSSKAAPR